MGCAQDDAGGDGLGDVAEVMSTSLKDRAFVEDMDACLNAGLSAWAGDEVGFEVEAFVVLAKEGMPKNGLDNTCVDLSRSLEGAMEV